MTPEGPQRMRHVYERRTFIDHCIRGTFWTAVAGTLYPLFSYFWPTAASQLASSNTLSVPLGELPVGASKKMGFRGGTVIVVRVSDTEARAVSAVCTHLGCLVAWKKEDHLLVCPCHAAKFDLNGTVSGGPAPLPLKIYQAKISGSNIIVEV